MAYQHGVYTSEIETSVQSAQPVDSALPFVVGTAPVVKGPVLVSTWSDFCAAFEVTASDYAAGDDGKIADSLVSFAYYWFVLAGRGDCFMQSVSSLGSSVVVPALQSINTIYERFGRVATILCVPSASEGDTIAAAMASAVANIGGRFKGVALIDIPAGFADSDDSIELASVHEYKPTTSPFACLCWPYVGVGDLRFAASVAMCAAMNATDGTYGGLPYVSPSNKALPVTGSYHVTDTALTESFTDCGAALIGSLYYVQDSEGHKITFGFDKEDATARIPGYPSVRVTLDSSGGTQYWRINDADVSLLPSSFPFEVSYTGPAEAPLYLTRDEVNANLGAYGVCGFRNTASGWVLWGDNTAAFPGSTDVKDYMIPVRRMFNHVSNQFQIFADGRVDMPLNNRQLEGVIKSFNQILSGWVGFGALNAASVKLDDDLNTAASLLSGVVYLRIMIAPPPAMVVIQGVLEYDVAGFASSLA